MKEETISRIAVVILAIVLAAFGIFHFVHPKNMLVFVPDSLPGGIIWVYVVGAAFILVALALILHKQVKLASYLLAFMLIIFVLTIHLPNFLQSGDVDMKQQSLVSLLKDSALAAFALYIASNSKTT
ncbi:hypothetical protein BH11BAC6_BH11BAC6_10400 [soil metagenome]